MRETTNNPLPAPNVHVDERPRRIERPRHPDPPRTLSQVDAAALSWFFGSGRTAFERSTFGPMLERAELYGHGSWRCSRCRGSGVLQGNGAWCDRCNGTGAIPYQLDPASSERIDQITAHSTGSNHGAGYVPDDTVMARYAVISRRLSLLPRRLALALEAYHGDRGIHCAAHHTWPMVAVYPLTASGQKLARLASEKGVPDHERCRLEIVAQRQQANPPNKPARGALIEAAERQATQLYVAAVDAWNALRAREAAERAEGTPNAKKGATGANAEPELGNPEAT